MQGSKTHYVDNTSQILSAGLTIRQKGAKESGGSLRSDRFLSYSDRTVLHAQLFSDTSLGPRLYASMVRSGIRSH
jgi:hypothetical protein